MNSLGATENYIAFDEPETIDSIASSVLKSLLYYDVFRFPLTVEEIKSHSTVPDCSISVVQESLNELCGEGLVFSYDKFYSVGDNNEVFLRRIEGNKAAEKVMKKAYGRSRLIASFPFVRCVCISGSLSKNYFDESTDVDFFIITEPNRLWICRTFLILFKKIFLFNSKKYYCVNYFIDSDNLVISDKNIFTATELITLLPMYNHALYKKFFGTNEWVKSIFPNSHAREMKKPEIKIAALKNIFEFFLKGNFGEWLDLYFMNRTLNHWKKKFGWQPSEEFEVNMRTRRNVSKHHPQGFQFQVLKKYEERIREFSELHQISLG